MRKLFNEFFYIPKHGKIREKVMLTHVVMTITIMVICLVVMSFSAYAYFSHSITSGSNLIKAANFEAEVSIQITGSDHEPVSVSKENLIHTAELKAGEKYSVTLSYPVNNTNAAKTGFCVITAKNSADIYYTQQLGADESVEGGRTPSITFELTVAKDTTVKILSHWGTSSHYDLYKNNTQNTELYICNGENVDISVSESTNSISGSDDEKDTDSDDTTATETTPGEVVYTVQANDTLSEIASQYGTTVARIAAYNGLADPDKISVNQKIKIPPADWAIPK